MTDFPYKIAEDLDTAWLNFELDLPLRRTNPFYVSLPHSPANELAHSLSAPFVTPPKRFLSGYRGCGKTTELIRLAESNTIQDKYWPIYFSIREEANISDLDFQDVLLAIANRMYHDYRSKGARLPSQLASYLDNWRGQVETETTSIAEARTVDTEVEAGLDAFFANIGIKMKREPKTRQVIRQALKGKAQEIITIIDETANAILVQKKLWPLILIDDLDKPDFEQSRRIFQQHLSRILQPHCAIVFTVATSLFFTHGFDGIRDISFFIPSVTTHKRDGTMNHQSFQIMRSLVLKRMKEDLIEDDALDFTISHSSGNFRELVRIMRGAITSASLRGASKIALADVHFEVMRIQNEFKRILDKQDFLLLNEIYVSQQYLGDRERFQRLMQIQAVMEYNDSNGNWYEVHPVLSPLLTTEPVLGELTTGLKKTAKSEKVLTSSPKVFLSYAREDMNSAQRLFDDLTDAGADLWFDQVSILPGQKWKVAIQQAIEGSRFFLALLSTRSVNKTGYIQKELKEGLDVLDQYPESAIFLIPVRLDDCHPSHERLRDLQWVDMFPDWDGGLARILAALKSQE